MVLVHVNLLDFSGVGKRSRDVLIHRLQPVCRQGRRSQYCHFQGSGSIHFHQKPCSAHLSLRKHVFCARNRSLFS